MLAQTMELPQALDFISGVEAGAGVEKLRPVLPRTPHIRFEGVNVFYGKSPAIVDLDLTLQAGEALALLGPSGSGKTTILRALAGFTRIRSGRISIHGADVSALPPQKRGFGIVVQNYALFPHMNVAENVAFGLRARRMAAGRTRSLVAEYLAFVGMSGYAGRYPQELSGGQQQRIALARALAIRPDVLLMDEPLSALDAPLRREMLGELIRLHRELPELTMLFVTHDQAEALALADRVGLLRDGKLQALDTPKYLYDRPPNRFAAEFLGQTNLLEVEVSGPADGEGMIPVRLGGQTLLVQPPVGCVARQKDYWLCLRPHQLSFGHEQQTTGQFNALEGLVTAGEWKGSHYRVSMRVEGQSLHMEVNAATPPPAPGSRAPLYFAASAAWLLPREE
ncbi:MAG: ABC transporter ATP-binding protein [Syntrophobacteraceae bacterium]